MSHEEMESLQAALKEGAEIPDEVLDEIAGGMGDDTDFTYKIGDTVTYCSIRGYDEGVIRDVRTINGSPFYFIVRTGRINIFDPPDPMWYPEGRDMSVVS